MSYRTHLIIPARYGASRLPGKVLLHETGKPLLQHTYEQALKIENVDTRIVAVDSIAVARAAAELPGLTAVVQTEHTHRSGTDRVLEVLRLLNVDDRDIVINVQADEPEINPEDVKCACDLVGKGFGVATVAYPARKQDVDNPARVKVLLRGDCAQYFSRLPVPYNAEVHLIHCGVYVYRVGFLKKQWPLLPVSDWENAENLEQLRILEAGISIGVHCGKGHCFGGVDTKQDYEDFVSRYYEKSAGQG